MNTFAIPVWPYAYGGPSGIGAIRTYPDDFIVEESLPFEPSGDGEHVFLSIRKIGENTDYVARQLARFAGVRQRDVGYAGLKDRHAVTTQWFSVWLPGKDEPDWSVFTSDSIQILSAKRHARKLKKGVLAGNRFQLTIRDWRGDRERLDRQLNRIKSNGVPNYFGEQRFGNEGRNVEKALAMFDGAKVKREQRSLYYSTARAFLFNHILALRVERGDWHRPIDGDAMIFDRAHSFFKMDPTDETLPTRTESGDIHPSGMLWGSGESAVSGEAALLEKAVIDRFDKLARALVDANLESARRALRVNVPDLHWQFDCDDRLQLFFTLPAGSFATAVLREIIET
ncbi:MAG: tRNA pseudouridine(13) synthase TruD [Methylomicrobium sp.]